MSVRIAGFLGAALLLSCAGAQVAPPAAGGQPAEDERGVLRLSDELEKSLATSGRLVEVPEVDAYLAAVAKRLEPEGPGAATFRVRVLRDRRVNAHSLANGALFITTGFLVRLDDEAELAAVLGHEMAHVHRKHTLLAQRKRAEVFQFALPAELSSYSKEHEREADADSVRAISAAGYAPAAVGSTLEKTAAWSAAEAIKDPKYSSHPPTQERVTAVKAQAAALPAGGASGVEPFEVHLAEVLLVNARLELAGARYEWARTQIERLLRLRPASAAGHALLGEIARREAAAGWESRAVASFRKALELDPKLAEAWRGLGLGLQKAGDDAGARRALATYLELAPDAPDRGHIRSYLDAQEGRATP